MQASAICAISPFLALCKTCTAESTPTKSHKSPAIMSLEQLIGPNYSKNQHTICVYKAPPLLSCNFDPVHPAYNPILGSKIYMCDDDDESEYSWTDSSSFMFGSSVFSETDYETYYEEEEARYADDEQDWDFESETANTDYSSDREGITLTSTETCEVDFEVMESWKGDEPDNFYENFKSSYNSNSGSSTRVEIPRDEISDLREEYLRNAYAQIDRESKILDHHQDYYTRKNFTHLSESQSVHHETRNFQTRKIRIPVTKINNSSCCIAYASGPRHPSRSAWNNKSRSTTLTHPRSR